MVCIHHIGAASPPQIMQHLFRCREYEKRGFFEKEKGREEGEHRQEKQNKEGRMRKKITESNFHCSLRLMIAPPQALHNLR